MNKRNLVMSILLGSVLIAGVFSITYAYFAINQSNTSSNVTIVTGNTTLVLDDVDPITKEDKISPNNTSITRYLTIRNEGSVDGYAKLLFKNLVNTFVLDDLTYTLEEVNSDKSSLSSPNIIVDNEVVPKSSSASNTELADGLLIPSNTSKYYKLTVSYDYKTDVNQDADLNKVLTSGFVIEEGSIIIRTTNGIEMKLASSNINSAIPSNGIVEKSFTLSNTTNETQTVNVELVNITNSNENLTADLSKGSTKLVENKSIPVGTNETVVLKNGLEVPANDNSSYTVTFNNTSNTNSNISASINAKRTTQIYCADESGNEIDCPTTFTLGDRVAIGRGENTQYFRYLRTTTDDENVKLNDCGYYYGYTGYYQTCTDNSTNSGAIIQNKVGYLRLIAENNLKKNDDSNVIDADALQDITDNPNGVPFYSGAYRTEGFSSYYQISYAKTYMDNYAAKLNTDFIRENDTIIGSILISHELNYLFPGCPVYSTSDGGGKCANKFPEWFLNGDNFWLGSASSRKKDGAPLIVHSFQYVSPELPTRNVGMRPVIMISESDFNRLAR